MLSIIAAAVACTTAIAKMHAADPGQRFTVPAAHIVGPSLAVLRTPLDENKPHTAFAVSGKDGKTYFLAATSALACDVDPDNCKSGLKLQIPPGQGQDAEYIDSTSRLVLLASSELHPPPLRLSIDDARAGQPLATVSGDDVSHSALLGTLLRNADVEPALIHSIVADDRYAGAPLFDPIAGDVLGVDLDVPSGAGLARGVGASEMKRFLDTVNAQRPGGIGVIARTRFVRPPPVGTDIAEKIKPKLWRVRWHGEVATAFVAGDDGRWTYLVTAAHAIGCDKNGNFCARDEREVTVAPPGASDEAGIPALPVRFGSCGNLDDIAVLRIKSVGAAPIGLARRIQAGMRVTALGIPELGDNGLGVVSVDGNLIDVANGGATVVHAAIAPRGFSGGPVVATETGELVGVAHGETADFARYEGISVAQVAAFLAAAGNIAVTKDATAPALPVSALESAYDEWTTTLYRDQDAYSAALVSRANAGDAAAAAALGNAFAFGHGVASSPAQAQQWDAKAAAASDPRGTYQLATDYAEGRGVARDAGAAYRYFADSARLHYAPAMAVLAAWTARGTGTTRDIAAASTWIDGATAAQAWQSPYLRARIPPGAPYRTNVRPCDADAPQQTPLARYIDGVGYVYGFAAERDVACGLALVGASAVAGIPYAELFLGRAYESGVLVDRDLAAAASWYQRSADHGMVDGAVAAALAIGAGSSLDRGYAATSTRFAQRAKDAGDPRGAILVGRALLAGFGIPADRARAYTVFQAAATAGSAAAHTYLATCYERGCGPSAAPDPSAAERELRAGAKGGDIAAIRRLAVGYATGRYGGAPSPQRALALYESYAPSDDTDAMTVHAEGLAAYGDPSGAAVRDRLVPLLTSAAWRGDARAQRALAMLYESGRGIGQNSYEALTWYFRAAEHGNDDAALAIARAYLDGTTVRRDHEEAMWFLRRAAFSNPAAMNALAEGEPNVLRTIRREAATTLFARAARRGFRMAQFHLGEAYLAGDGVAPDTSCAALWMLRSAHAPADDAADAAASFWPARYVALDKRTARAESLLAALPPAAAARIRAQVADNDIFDDQLTDCP